MFVHPVRVVRGTWWLTNARGDHPFASSDFWWQSRIDCPVCSQVYDVEDNDSSKPPAVVLRADVADRKAKLSAWIDMRDQLVASPVVQLMMNKFVIMVNNEGSKAAQWRVLRKHQLTQQSQQTFTRNKEDLTRLATHAAQHSMLELMKMTGINDASVLAMLAATDAARAAANEPIPPVPTGIKGMAA